MLRFAWRPSFEGSHGSRAGLVKPAVPRRPSVCHNWTMGARMALLAALVLVMQACGGDEFSDDNSGGSGGATGGSSGSGGSSGGATGGTSGSGGNSGSAGTGGFAGDASAGDAAVDASVDAGPQPIEVVQTSPTKLSMAPAELTSSITLSTTPTAGNSIIVGVTCISDHGVVVADGGGTIANGDCLMPTGSVTDNRGNSYTQVVQGSPIKSSHQAARGYIFIAQGIAAPSGAFTIQVDPEGNSGGQGIAWGAIEVRGLSAAPSLDATGYTASASGTATTAATFQATTQANELAVAVLSIRHNSVNAGITHDSTWDSRHLHQDSVNGPPAHSMVSKILTSTGTCSHGWTHEVPSRGAAGLIATFKGVVTN